MTFEHLSTAAGKKAQQKNNIHIYRAYLLCEELYSSDSGSVAGSLGKESVVALGHNEPPNSRITLNKIERKSDL